METLLWIIGIAALSFFGAIGYSMAIMAGKTDKELGYKD